MPIRLDKAESDLLKPTFYRIPINFYQSGEIIEEDVYFLYQGNYLLYRLKNLIWKEEDLKKLKAFEVQSLYIKQVDKRNYNRFLERRLEKILDEVLISDSEKVEVIYSVSSSLLEELFENPNSRDHLKRSSSAIRHSIDFLSKDKNHFFDLMKLATSSFSEYTHGLHVAAYSVTLAREMGFKSFNQLTPIGIGAILHDIGKVKIPKEILEKSDNLNEAERAMVERHPEIGYEIVKQSKVLPSLAETIILQHHERKNGAGYPRKLTDDLNTFSQIVGLADTFDLLTSERSYQKAMRPMEAIEYLREVEKDSFSPELIYKFISMLKKS